MVLIKFRELAGSYETLASHGKIRSNLGDVERMKGDETRSCWARFPSIGEEWHDRKTQKHLYYAAHIHFARFFVLSELYS